jgi:hypothetical protein
LEDLVGIVEDEAVAEGGIDGGDFINRSHRI